MVRLVFPHRKLLLPGIGAAIVYALLHSVSILGMLPILKVLLEEEGLHGWLDRTAAETRTGLSFRVVQSKATSTEGDAGSLTLEVHEIDTTSPTGRSLFQQGIRRGDVVLALDEQPLSPREWLSKVASADAHTTVRFSAQRSAQREIPPGDYAVVVNPLPTYWRVAHLLASVVPRENTASARMTALRYVLSVVVLLVILANASRFVADYFIGRAVFRAMLDLRRKLYAKVLKLPMSRFTRDTGDLVSRFVQDIQDVQRGVNALFSKSIREPLKAVFILAAALVLDWRITITMIFVAPWAMLLFWKVGTSIKKANRKLLRGYGAMVEALGVSLGAIGIIKAYTSENTERLRLMHIDRQMFRQQVKIVRLQALLSPALEVLGVVTVSIVTVWLGGRVLSGDIELAKFGTLVLVLAMLFDPLRKMADVYARIQRSAAGADRLCETLDSKDEVEAHSGTLELGPLQSQIEFRDVTFVYPEADAPALDEVNLVVPRGEVVALVGRNGSGKTTLVNMLTRFHDPQSGVILFDGVDIRDATLRSLRKRFGLVTQDSVVFPIPLADNISYGSRNRSRDAVIDAAKRAHADEFIRTKPQGYDTVPGDGGKTLSGGQRQRIAIARAIFKNAPILIFDEATSQIDTESEQKIQAALKEFSQDRTTFIIAHRLSTITFADRIVVMDAGKIIDTGPHDELLKRCTLYRGLCETQLLS